MSTARGNQYLLVITDIFSKRARNGPIRVVITATVEKQFVNHWVLQYDPPLGLISNNDRQFTSIFIGDVCKKLNENNLFTTSYHSQTNGKVESFNRTIVSTIHAYVTENHRDWGLYSSTLTYDYNCQQKTFRTPVPIKLVPSNLPVHIPMQN